MKEKAFISMDFSFFLHLLKKLHIHMEGRGGLFVT